MVATRRDADEGAIESALQPTSDQSREFRDDPYDGPIAQVNRLKVLTTRVVPTPV